MSRDTLIDLFLTHVSFEDTVVTPLKCQVLFKWPQTHFVFLAFYTLFMAIVALALIDPKITYLCHFWTIITSFYRNTAMSKNPNKNQSLKHMANKELYTKLSFNQ